MVKVIRHEEFGKRLQRIADANPKIPPKHDGRYRFIAREFMNRFNRTVNHQSVQMWFDGETKPSGDRLQELAIILDGDLHYITTGLNVNQKAGDVKTRAIAGNGAVNVLAGFMQLDGSAAAFPEENDKQAEEDSIDIYGIIKGARYNFHVALGYEDDGLYVFTIPRKHDTLFILGAMRTSGPGVVFCELSHELIAENGKIKHGNIQLTITPERFNDLRITAFDKRL